MSKNSINIYESIAPAETKQNESNTIKKEKRSKKWIKKHKALTCIICIILTAAIAAGAIFIANRSSESPSYAFIRTTTLSKGDLENSISATGTVESAKSSTVTTSLNYKIKLVIIYIL